MKIAIIIIYCCIYFQNRIPSSLELANPEKLHIEEFFLSIERTFYVRRFRYWIVSYTKLLQNLSKGKKYVKTNSRAPVLHPYFGGNHRVDQSHYAQYTVVQSSGGAYYHRRNLICFVIRGLLNASKAII